MSSSKPAEVPKIDKCGSVMEVKITNLPSGSVATVEFTDRVRGLSFP